MEMLGITLEPFANLAYLNLRTDDFTEAGGAAALTSQADTIENVITTFGIRPSSDPSIWVASRDLARHGGLAACPRHRLADLNGRLRRGGSDFNISAAPIARDAMALEAGVDFAVADNISAGPTQWRSAQQQNHRPDRPRDNPDRFLIQAAKKPSGSAAHHSR